MVEERHLPVDATLDGAADGRDSGPGVDSAPDAGHGWVPVQCIVVSMHDAEAKLTRMNEE